MSALPVSIFLLAVLSVSSAIREALPEEFPFQVSVQTNDKRHLCGGALITRKWVVTSSECIGGINSVLVAYGSADAGTPIDRIPSNRIIHQRDMYQGLKNRLALVELSQEIVVSKTASPAKLPTEKAILRNTTKLSGWNVRSSANMPNLSVTDKYFVITQDCRTTNGMIVPLSEDEFCGMAENFQNDLTSQGSIVSKSAIVLGLLAQHTSPFISPNIYVKMSLHEQWIRDTLGSEAQNVNWVTKVPENAAHSNYALSLLTLGVSTFLLRFL